MMIAAISTAMRSNPPIGISGRPLWNGDGVLLFFVSTELVLGRRGDVAIGEEAPANDE